MATVLKDDFLPAFLGNKNRARILRVFVFNANEVMTIADIAKRSGVAPKAALKEVKSLVTLGAVKPSRAVSITLANKSKRTVKGNTKVAAWATNNDFKHLRAISSFIHEVSPVRYDNIVGALKRGGRISAVILSGTFMGDDSRPADLVVAADMLNERRLERAIKSLEPAFGREIRYAAFSTPEFRYRLTVQDRLIRDTLDFPHVVLLDKTRML
jgi:DNA-binding Lrp family transcriptional regulator